MRPTYKNIARIVRVHGNKGEVVVEACQGFPFLIELKDTLWVVPPKLSRPRSVSVVSIRGGEENQDSLSETVRRVVAFREVTSISAAEELVGTYLLKDAALISADDLACGVHGFLSKPVCDVTYGHLGSIKEVLRSAFQDTLVVEGAKGEIMIPVHEEFIEMNTVSSSQITVHIPLSLLPDGFGDEQ